MRKHLTVFADFDQGTPPWEFVRLGMITTSDYNLLNRRGKQGGESITRRRRIFDVANELMAMEPSDTKWTGNRFTERGKALEEEAFDLYCMTRGVDETLFSRPAFIRDNKLRTGCSPDALIGGDGGVEIKTMAGGMFLDLMENPRVPPEHVAQVQGCMLVTGRDWWDVMIYSPPYAPLITRLEADPAHHREMLDGLREFNTEVERIVMKHRGETVQTCWERKDARLNEIVAEWQEQTTEVFSEHSLSELSSDGDGGAHG